MAEIFVSYSRQDVDLARALAEALEARGWSVWWDIQDLRAGKHFDDDIQKAITNAKCVVVLWSTRSVESEFVKDEATYALELGKLLPVTIENVRPPLRFQRLHTVQLQGWTNSALFPGFQELMRDLEERIGPPTEVPKKAKPTTPATALPVRPVKARPPKVRMITQAEMDDAFNWAESVTPGTAHPLATPTLSVSMGQLGNLLSWTPVPGASAYLLQRSPDESFLAHVQDIYQGTDLSFSDAAGAISEFQLSPIRGWRPTFYYRVMANAVPGLGTDGHWSNIIQV